MRRLLWALLIWASPAAWVLAGNPSTQPATTPSLSSPALWAQRFTSEGNSATDPQFLARLALARLSSGDRTAARALLARAESLANKMPDARQQCEAYLSLAGALARLGDAGGYQRTIAAAMRYPDRAADAVTRATLYDFIAAQQASVLDGDGWQATVNKMADSRFRASACIGAGRRLLGTSDPKQYLGAANLAEQAIAGVPDPLHASSLLRDIVELHAQGRNFPAAYRVASSIKDNTWKAMAYLAIAAQQAAAGDAAAAANTIAQARAVPVEKMSWGEIGFLTLLARTEAGIGNAAGASQSLGAAHELADAYTSGRRKAAAHVDLAATQLRLGMKTAAMENIKSAEAARSTTAPTQPMQLDPLPQAYCGLALAYAAAGDLAAARTTANAIAQLDLRRLAYGSMVSELAGANRCEEAASLLGEVGNGAVRRQAVLAIAAAFARTGKFAALSQWVDSLANGAERADAAVEVVLTLAPPALVAIASTQPSTRPTSRPVNRPTTAPAI